MRNAERFYSEFVQEKGEEFFNSIAKKNQLTRNDPEYEDTKNYILHLAQIFNLKKLDQTFECTPASTSATNIFDEMLEHDVKGFINEESYYNINKSERAMSNEWKILN